MELTNNFLSLLSQGLLVIALPVVIAAAVQHIRAMNVQINAHLSQQQQQNINQAVNVAVRVAEQTGVLKNLVGPEKQKQAIQVAETFLAGKGIKLDLDKLVPLIEAEVQSQFGKAAPPVDSPQARQALIDGAIQSAVLAAEQSGLTGLIRNAGPEKKAYALQMAAQYLSQHGIKVDPQLMNGLIESQLLKLVLGARGQLPATGAKPGG